MSVTTTSSRAGKFESRFWHKLFEEEVGRVKGHLCVTPLSLEIYADIIAAPSTLSPFTPRARRTPRVRRTVSSVFTG